MKAMPEPHPRNAPDPLFKEFFALDSTAALKNCGSAETFREAVKNFREDIEEKANLIEEYAKSSDWKNYTILVHALKSSARLIGATELSELAREVEAKGDEAQKDEKSAITTILEKTPELLAQYRAYYAKLAPLCEENSRHPEFISGSGNGILKQVQNDGGEQVQNNDSSVMLSEAKHLKQAKPLITKAQFDDALSALGEVISAFDFDSADSIIKEIDSYAIPTEFVEKYAKIKKAVRNVDATKVRKLIEN